MRYAILAVCCLAALAAGHPDTLWVRLYDTIPGYQSGKDILVTDNGQLYVVGTTTNPSMRTYWAVRRMTLDGETVWTESLLSVTSPADRKTTKFAYSRVGTVVVAVSSIEAPSFHLMRRYLFAYDTAGVLLWQRVFESENTKGNLDLCVDDAGYSYLTGQTATDSGGADVHTMKVGPTGEVVWERVWDGAAHEADMVQAVAVDSAGGVYVAGLTVDSSGREKPFAAKYSAAGDSAWVSVLCPGDSHFGCYNDVVVGPDGYIYAVGADITTPQSPGPAVKYRPEGDTVWCRWVEGQAHFLALDSEGCLAVAGYAPGGQDFRSWKLDPEGDSLWQRTYDGPQHLPDWPADVTTDRFSNVIVVGRSNDSIIPEVDVLVVLVYSAAGELLCAERYRHPGRNLNMASAVATDEEGCVYITGVVYESRHVRGDWITMKYPATPSGMEAEKSDVGSRPVSQTICRGVLRLPGSEAGNLVDISGRRVMELQPGENDIRHVAPGVYFVRIAESGTRSAVRKIVFQR